MLYTIMPLEEVWAELDQEIELREVTYQGCTMQIEPIDSSSGKIVRILSTDPQHYLNPTLQPGSTITFFGEAQ